MHYMQRVTGIGGIFFKAANSASLYDWYEKHLGIKQDFPGQGAMFHWRDAKDPEKPGITVWSIFPETTKYLDPSKSRFMINYRVENLDALLEALHAEGVEIDPKREDHDYGRFAWITDPEGNKIELWEPPKGG
jgi:predicted enzyme related to lactoylglutathione lyase